MDVNSKKDVEMKRIDKYIKEQDSAKIGYFTSHQTAKQIRAELAIEK
jgi:hypothetical protein